MAGAAEVVEAAEEVVVAEEQVVAVPVLLTGRR